LPLLIAALFLRHTPDLFHAFMLHAILITFAAVLPFADISPLFSAIIFRRHCHYQRTMPPLYFSHYASFR